MTDYLRGDGWTVNPKCIRRLMRKMMIIPIFPQRSLSSLGKPSYKYKYLLRGMKIDLRNQVWCIDITYIPMHHGFMYLTAIIDVYNRKIIAWGCTTASPKRIRRRCWKARFGVMRSRKSSTRIRAVSIPVHIGWMP